MQVFIIILMGRAMMRIKNKLPFFACGILVIAGLGLGCQKEHVKVYVVPSEKVNQAEKNIHLAAHKHAPLKWVIPNHWQKESPTAMQEAAFSIHKKNETVLVSVVSLGGTGGGLRANINRWRNQLQLAPIAPDDPLPVPQKIGPHMVTIVEIESEVPSSGKQLTKLIVAMISHESKTYFFKMQGGTAGVASEKEPFLKVIEDVRFH